MIQAACEAVVNFRGAEVELKGGRTGWTEYPWPIAFDARPENDDERNLRCFLLDMQRKHEAAT